MTANQQISEAKSRLRPQINNSRPKPNASDPYRFHRLALSPLLSDKPAEAFNNTREALRKKEEQSFLLFVLQNGLGPLWHESLQKSGADTLFPPEYARELRNMTVHVASLYLYQQIALEKIDAILARNSIPYAVIKGVHTREMVYPDPSLRYACDIDILVSRDNRIAAIKALVDAGYAFQPNPKNISHEATLTGKHASIDLHWNIMRPGRTRVDLTDEFLATGKRYTGYHALNNEAHLFIMLVHPVFTKYLTAPQASLLLLIDLVRWLDTQKFEEVELYHYLDKAGLKTAAWITASWLHMMTGESLAESLLRKVQPSKIRTAYLRKWLELNLPTRLLRYPFLVQAGFTLPAHDNLGDTIRFFKNISQEKTKKKQIFLITLWTLLI
jgi:hypothetical protein